MEVTKLKRGGMSGVGVLAILLILTIMVGTVMYIDETQTLNGQISSLQSQVSALQTKTVTVSSSSQSPPDSQVIPTTRHFSLIVTNAPITIATNVTYDAWTFNGTVPGPTIWVNQGDTIDFTLYNPTSQAHSIDFHAAQVDWSTDYATVPPGGSKTFNFTVNYPGIFMYHCGTAPVLEHIANGMFGAIIVNPQTPLPAATGGTYVLVENEWYLNSQPGADGHYTGNLTKMLAATPDYVTFNGTAFQFQKSPLPVAPNQLVRLYILNVGPSLWEAFHVIGAIMDTVFIDGNPSNVMHGQQTLNIPPSGGAIVDMYFPDAGGKNPFVNHAFAYASIGAVGIFKVGTANQSSTTSTTSSTQTYSTPVTGSVSVAINSGSALNTTSIYFSPPTITVVIGVNNTVIWTNDDSAEHTVTATNNSFNSGYIEPGQSFTYTFTTPGTYTYYCTIHPWMKGTVIVEAAG
ncbi:MAG TPA: multicopper oxidase domain-containing protein [Candidatus Acidoferrales bacterium]|nr:multicopper oxidase domain-containing protein [Candidatus Acidoferrales bacterium]